MTSIKNISATGATSVAINRLKSAFEYNSLPLVRLHGE
jgi:hypothetical protein